MTGANGQIGRALVSKLCERQHSDPNVGRCGEENVFTCDIRKPAKNHAGKFYLVDVTKSSKYERVVRDHKIDCIFHMAAILSGTAIGRVRNSCGREASGTVSADEH